MENESGGMPLAMFSEWLDTTRAPDEIVGDRTVAWLQDHIATTKYPPGTTVKRIGKETKFILPEGTMAAKDEEISQLKHYIQGLQDHISTLFLENNDLRNKIYDLEPLQPADDGRSIEKVDKRKKVQ